MLISSFGIPKVKWDAIKSPLRYLALFAIDKEKTLEGRVYLNDVSFIKETSFIVFQENEIPTSYINLIIQDRNHDMCMYAKSEYKIVDQYDPEYKMLLKMKLKY